MGSNGTAEHLLLPEALAYYKKLKDTPETLAPTQLRTPTDTRERLLAKAYDLPPQFAPAKVSEAQAQGPRGKIALKIYRPKASAVNAGKVPILVYFHGGGFVAGDLITHCARAAAYSSIIGAVVVAVDYRLAPEHPFPAGVEDAWAATLWASSHAEEFGGDPRKLVVIGESAGGNLAAVMSLLAKEQSKDSLIMAQISICALFDAADDSRPSRVEFCNDASLDSALLQWYLGHYLRGVDADLRDPHISPMYARDLTGLPPTFILTAEVDIVRDEAEEYASKLEAAGVKVKCKRYKGHFHNSPIEVPLFGKAAEDTIREIKAFIETVAGNA